MEHKLKILSEYYAAILQGKKTFEVRKDDRPFQEGDTLLLQETVTPDGLGYTGREMKVDVTYILRDSKYVKDGYCIMGIKIISTNKSRYYNNTANKPERIGKWWIERDKERCVDPYHCGNCDIYGSYIGYSRISKYCPRCGIKMDTSKVYEYEEATKEARQNET